MGTRPTEIALDASPSNISEPPGHSAGQEARLLRIALDLPESHRPDIFGTSGFLGGRTFRFVQHWFPIYAEWRDGFDPI